MKADG